MTNKNKRDYYDILGIEKNANDKDIKLAFRKLAMKWHPDKNKAPEAHDKFTEINEAYMVLSDPDKRTKYDRFGFNGLDMGDGGVSGGGFSSFGDIMDMFFGGMGGDFGFGGRSSGNRRRRVHGEDIEITLKIDFLEAVFGAKKDIEYKRYEPCGACEGKGGADVKKCPKCKGSGQETRTTRSFLGLMQQVTTCSTCRGEGEVVKTPCKVCKGRKMILKTNKTSINIPGGVDNDMHLKIQGHGQLPTKDAIPGDLYVRIRVKPNEDFQRDGDNIISEIKISFINAIKGCNTTIKTVDGPIKLKIPEGTQPDTLMRLRNKGIIKLQSRGSVRGHHIVTVKVMIPKFNEISKINQDTLNKYESNLAKTKDNIHYHK